MLINRVHWLIDNLKARCRLLSTSLLLIIVVLLVWLYHSAAFFPLKTVKVYGDFPGDAKAAIKQLVQVQEQRSFFSYNIRQLEQALQDLPWVASVTIRRVWPETLSIRLVALKAVAIWNGSELLMKNMEIYLPRHSVLPNNLPEFTANRSQAREVYQMYQKMNDILSPIRLNISKIALNDQLDWQITLSNGIALLLTGNRAISEVSRFTQAYPKAFAKKKKLPRRVDMRYEHGMAVKWT